MGRLVIKADRYTKVSIGPKMISKICGDITGSVGSDDN